MYVPFPSEVQMPSGPAHASRGAGVLLAGGPMDQPLAGNAFRVSVAQVCGNGYTGHQNRSE